MRQIAAIAKVTLLENLRKQLLQVVVLLTIAVIAAVCALSLYDTDVKVKLIKDLSLASVLLAGAVLAIATSVSSIHSELQARTAYPVLARPISRPRYVLAKYVGSLGTCFLCMLIIGGVFLAAVSLTQGRFDPLLAAGIGFVMLEVAVIAAAGTLFGVLVSPMVAATLCVFLFALGQVKVSYLHQLIERSASPGAKWLLSGLYYALPNLDSFSLKDALVHNIAVPGSYLLLIAVYALFYSALLLWIAGMALSWKRI